MPATSQQEIAARERFAFGENWRPDLHGKTFLDIGCGSGLFSLVARRLGARVHSFDYDLQSVACAQELRRRYFPEDTDWRIEEGSALDLAYLRALGSFDVVYSWGVLHHTGAMWEALDNAAGLVAPAGKLFIAIYNDQGKVSNRWRAVKRMYNRLPDSLRFVITIPALVHFSWRSALKDALRGRPFETWRNQGQERGMSPWWDLIDWVGGYPFEVAKPEEILHFYSRRGFILTRLTTCGGSLGCNEYVFAKTAAAANLERPHDLPLRPAQ
jgi:SAM-dependent methyltransferase